MALFSTKKAAPATEEKAPKKAAKAVKATKAVVAKKDTGTVSMADLSSIITSPRITEKAAMHVAQGVYVFDVSERSTKRDIFAAVRKFYAVTPRMVRIARVPDKMKRNARTGKSGMRSGNKKAYVYLKKGDSISIS